MHTITEKLRAFERLLDVMDTLREKCPWDHKQTIQSLRPNTIEETYELSEAILGGNMADIREELGDIIMHIVFYSKIGEESKQFDIADVCNAVCDKLIYRHPHVYPPKDGVLTQVTSSEQVKAQWEQLKTQE
ncbi:MAG: nucleoside triphosphate pyrophosphohydrolase, partial [Alloprevotella tannerae]|nr:nucleoside triphosphate pyrophosphohydrolase [Alloprevotella tannerae]